MNILFLKGFNNYFNRIIVKYDTLLEYTERSKSNVVYTSINFNPNDGISTELIVGSEGQQISSAPLDWETSGSPDYLVCFEPNEIIDNDSDSSDEPADNIISRWFVIECQRTRLGQYRLVLKRDIIADNLTAVEDATCFINKGIIEDIEDPALFNKEDVTTNQIKSDEFLLKDETQSGWIIGYVAKDRDDGEGHLVPTTFTEQSIPGPQANDLACSEIYSTESAFWQAHPELMGDLATLNSWTASVRLDIQYTKWFSDYYVGQIISVFNNGNFTYKEAAFNNKTGLYQRETTWAEGWKGWFYDIRDKLASQLIKNWRTSSFKNSVLEQLSAKENIEFASESKMQSFFNFIKRKPVIKIGDKFYIPYDKYGEDGAKSTCVDEHQLSVGSSAYDLFNTNIDRTLNDPLDSSFIYYIDGTPTTDTFKLAWSYNRHALGLREIFSTCKAKIPANVPVLKDAPYHMFAIPFADNLALYEGNTLHCVTNKSVAMNAAQALAQQSGVGVIYDVQLLPYCPVRDIIKTEKITAHAEIVPATYDKYYAKLGAGTQFERYVSIPVAKLNHRYVISKDIGATTRAVGIKSHIVNNTASPLKIKIGTDLENPTEYYDAYEVLVTRSNLQDLTSSLTIKIYKTIESVQQDTPEVVLDYATYVSGDNYIGFEATDNCEYSEVITGIGGVYTLQFIYLPSGGQQGGELRGIPTWSSLVKEYIYYEDYYMTKLDITNAITSDIVVTLDGVETDIVNTIFWCTDSQFSFNKYLDNYFLLQSDGSYKQDAITDLINEKVKRAANAVDTKVRSQVEMLRLAAPNYSSFFDVNVQYNKGIEYINVDCTYKPYQPYIHLNPNFKGLYGADYNDVRGLICSGDYSIAITTDAWATYQLQNKNYQAIFDRQIQQLEVQNDIAHQQDIINAITGVGSGTVSGAVGGALTGAKVGGGYGAIAGAIAGGVTGLVGSTFGAAIDVNNAERIRELQISTSKDIYRMQLDNIKALPLGLAKTSYLTNNNKLFPFLEFYTCTPVEEMAVRDLINYNGMTINRIGKISDFQSYNELPYIKAKLIRIDTIEDAHQVKAISDELATGVYLPEGD